MLTDFYGLQDERLLQDEMRKTWKSLKRYLVTRKPTFFFVSGVGRYHHKAPPHDFLGSQDPASPFTVAYRFSPISAVTGAGKNSIFRFCGGERRCEIVGHLKISRGGALW